jgi:DNA repair protein RecN (Recombination protein N)
MLDELTVANLGLIASADVRLSAGLNVITGETGTGKTLMLGALRLLRGDKAAKGLIGPYGDTCEVAVRFVDGSDEVVLRRSVDAKRSRAYVDDMTATAATLADILAQRVSIVGQHDQLAIASTAGVRSLVDRRLGPDGLTARAGYEDAWRTRSALLEERAAIGSDARALERERDIAEFQADEIERARLSPGEDDDLHQRVLRLRNADALLAELDTAMRSLGDGGAGSLVDEAVGALRRAHPFASEAGAIGETLLDVSTMLNDAAGDVAVLAASIEQDPGELDAVEERIALIGSLKRKYGATVGEIIAFGVRAGSERDRLDALLASAADIDERVAIAEEHLTAAGRRLREARSDAAKVISAEAMGHLLDLGFASPHVEIDVGDRRPTPDGADRPVILFASAEGLEPEPISSVASGGELSRLVLALTLASGSEDLAVLAFDEIDSGIGGATALAMGHKLKELAVDHQVICVSHLPQVASFADTHIVVSRSDAGAVASEVEGADRLEEITRMLSGLTGSDTGREHAKDLLAIAAGDATR